MDSAEIWNRPERWLRAIIEGTEAAVMGESLDGMITSWAGAATHMFGYTAEEAIGMPVYQLAWTGEESKIPDLLAAVRRGERINDFRTSRRHKDGHRIFVSLDLFPIRDESGEVVGIAKIAHDLSERVSEQEDQARMRAELLAERKYRELTEHAPDGILELDASGRIIIANKTAESMFGMFKGELIGSSIEILIPQSQRGRHPEHRKNFMQQGKARPMGTGLHLNAVRKDGSEFPVEISLSPIHTDDGMLVIAAVRDVSEKRIVEEEMRRLQESYLAELQVRQIEAERLNRLKSEFLASVSHELRTPLHTIIGFTDLLKEDPHQTLTMRQLRYLENIERDSGHLLALINDVLDLSRIEAGGLLMHPERVHLCRALFEYADGFRTSADKKGISMDVECPEDIYVTTDPTRLRQIVVNLLSNAIKFTPPDGKILVVAIVEDTHVRVSITDTGMGIAEEEQRNIFEKFYQVGFTTGGIREGTGLGLAICKRLVEMQGGTLEVKSRVNQGSTFSFTLPCDGEHIAT